MISGEWSASEWNFLRDKCLNEGWSNFHQQDKSNHWHAHDLETISTKCPNLKNLAMQLNANIMPSWPILPTPWTSLQNLTIHSLKFGGMFEGVELQQTLPNLRKIFLFVLGKQEQEKEPSFLPDLRGCDKLEAAIFLHGFFRFNGEILPGDEMPLPPGLKWMNLMGSRFHEEFMNRIKYEDIKKVLPLLQSFGVCKIPERFVTRTGVTESGELCSVKLVVHQGQ